MDTSTFHAILHAQIDLLLGEQRDAVKKKKKNLQVQSLVLHPRPKPRDYYKNAHTDAIAFSGVLVM